MTILTGDLKSITKQPFDGPDCYVVLQSAGERVEGGTVVTRELRRIHMEGTGGVFRSPDMYPGPVTVTLEGGTVHGTSWTVTLPESGEVNLANLIGAQTEYPPAVVGEAQQAATNASESKRKAEEAVTQAQQAASTAEQVKKDTITARDEAREAVNQAKQAASAASQDAVQQAMNDLSGLVRDEITRQIGKLPAGEGVDPEKIGKAVEEYFRQHPQGGGGAAPTPEAIQQAVGNKIAEEVNKAVTNLVETQIKEIVTAAGDAGVINVKPAEGTDITTALQAAINDASKKVIQLPAGEWGLSNTINLDKLSGKVMMGQGDATVLKMKRGVGKNAMQSTSGGNLRRGYMSGFVIDMDWVTGERPATALQITNADYVKLVQIGVMNSGANAFLLQGFVRKEKATGNGTNDSLVLNCWTDGSGLKQNTAQEGASGFGIMIKDESNRNQIIGNQIRRASCGMGIGGRDTTDPALRPETLIQGAPKDTLVSGNSVVMADNQSIAFEPIGFTIKCYRTNITGNMLPVSKDNGISVGGYSVVMANTIGETWNHGIACSGHGTKIQGNDIWNVGLENQLRPPADGPKDWAAVALEDPIGCTVIGNSYAQDNPKADCAHMVKIVLRKGTKKEQVGGNTIIGNSAQEGTVKKDFIFNGNFNPARPDMIITIEEWKKLLDKPDEERVRVLAGEVVDERLKKLPPAPAPAPAASEASPLLKALETREGPTPGLHIHPFQLWARGARRLAPVTYSWPKYWEAIEHARDVTANYLHNPQIAGPFIANPHSGVGTKKENDYELTLTTTAALGMVNIAYVLTGWGGRAHSEIIKEIDQFIEYYGRHRIHGVFLDEAVNGWGDQASKVQGYVELYGKLRAKYGSAFYITANPGGNTVEGMLGAADTLMAFEQSAQRYIDDETICPGHYRGHNPLRFWHAVHNVTDVEQAKQVLNRASVSNVGMIWLTTDTFTGELGSESEWNNPWDNAPDKDVLRETINFVRRDGNYILPVEYG